MSNLVGFCNRTPAIYYSHRDSYIYFMKVIIDNGGSKADWLVITAGAPSFVLQTAALDVLATDKRLAIGVDAIRYLAKATTVELYSTGIYSEVQAEIAATKLQPYLAPGADLSLGSDMMAACKATAGSDAGIICILGTGSNSCVYDGSIIVQQIPALGYIMGDEGSGTAIGKALIKAYLYGEMPKAEAAAFTNRYGLTKEVLLKNIGQEPSPQRYLASHTMYLQEVDTQWTRALVKNCLRAFFERRVLSYGEYLPYTIHFVGSIAYFYRSILEELCLEYELQLGTVMQKPIEGLQQKYI